MGRVTKLGNLVVTQLMDNGSPDLAHAWAMNPQFDHREIILVTDTDTDLTLTLEKVIEHDMQMDYASGKNRPMIKLTLDYQKASCARE